MIEEFNRPTPFAATSTSNTKEGSFIQLSLCGLLWSSRSSEGERQNKARIHMVPA
jgi:hypothetical protein